MFRNKIALRKRSRLLKQKRDSEIGTRFWRITVQRSVTTTLRDKLSCCFFRSAFRSKYIYGQRSWPYIYFVPISESRLTVSAECLIFIIIVLGIRVRFLSECRCISQCSLHVRRQFHRLTVPAVKLSTIGSRAFSVSGPQTWNQLPEEITSATSLSTFQRHLKTFLFRKSFPDIIADWHFSGPCGNLNYLGHSKKFCLIDWLKITVSVCTLYHRAHEDPLHWTLFKP